MENDDDLRPRDDADLPWRARLARLLEFRPREVVALAIVGALVLAGAVVAFARARPSGTAPPAAAPIAAPSPATAGSPSPARLFVHVAGAVRNPGVYEFASGARLVDAIRQAGGAGPHADLNAVNLARPVSDGERVYVPKSGEAPPAEAAPGEPGATVSDGKVNLNTATAGQLEELPGIGPVLAQRIVDYRTQHGPFRSVRDLLKVEGIGEKKFASIEPHVTV
jgi:competence protein ComEA